VQGTTRRTESEHEGDIPQAASMSNLVFSVFPAIERQRGEEGQRKKERRKKLQVNFGKIKKARRGAKE